ncbi:MAG: YihY/virulence factor BrkB family protein [Pirellulales bacterium]|nr:YihY/virulence factor BrkB family protein [Pirellulales bacterium]
MRTWFKTRMRQLGRTSALWRRHDGGRTAASMAYYAVLSFFPLLILLIAVVGYVLQFSSGAQDAQARLLHLLAQNTTPALAEHVHAVLTQIQTRASVGGPVGLAALLIAAIGMFTQLDKAIERIWATKRRRRRTFLAAVRRTLTRRLRAFVMLLVLGLLIGVAFVAGAVVSAVRPLVAEGHGGMLLWASIHSAASIVVNGALLTLVYKLLPRARVFWSAAARGGTLAAVLWEISRIVLSLLLLGKKYTAYGVVGSLMALMLWIYLASAVFFFAAEYVHVIQRDALAKPPSHG